LIYRILRAPTIALTTLLANDFINTGVKPHIAIT